MRPKHCLAAQDRWYESPQDLPHIYRVRIAVAPVAARLML